uniref:Uncharacterized protein n=1 Tax=viral metagenome TaxID=1070528 RepID=A0A6C0ECA3_9ZZZZ
MIAVNRRNEQVCNKLETARDVTPNSVLYNLANLGENDRPLDSGKMKHQNVSQE